MNSSKDYLTKPDSYFSGARKIFVDDLPENLNANLLEVGCGNGDTAAYAKSIGKCGYAVGIEICPEPAELAAHKMDRVIVGDIEDLVLDLAPRSFDILILSEVLEHLRNPDFVLLKLKEVLRPGSWIMAGSPNVANREVLKMLLRGDWTLEDSGVMDRTHLRWFTAKSYCKLFLDAGFRVERVGPARPLKRKAAIINALTFGKLEHLFYSQIYLRAQLPLE